MGKRLYRFVNDRKKDIFLNNLIDKAGNISKAAEESGITRQTHYDWLANDDRYATAYEQKVKPACLGILEDEALRRGVEGYDEDVYYKGEKVGTVRKYSDRLLELLLKGAAPDKYGTKTETRVMSEEGGNIVRWDGDEDG